MKKSKSKNKSNTNNKLLEGKFISKEKGYGFVEIDETTINNEELDTRIRELLEESIEKDIFIARSNNKLNALDGDKVLIKLLDKELIGDKIEGKSLKGKSLKGRSLEGEIIKILEHKNDTVVGIFQKSKNFGFLVPDNKNFGTDIFIPKNACKGAKNNQKVVVKITKYPFNNKNAEGKVIEILGNIDSAGVDMLSLIKEYKLPYEFPKKVLDEARQINQLIDKKDIPNRKDLTNNIIFTIDGEDAKDLDDAISLDILENGNFLLGVHIADVSHYVRENTPLDKEAYKRGTSVYLVDRVIPMLPHKLSNGICSLNPHEDRLALSCIMEINHKAEVVNHRVVKSIIHSDKRMTYTAVREVLEEKTPALLEEYADFVDMLENMNRLRILLSEKREKRGSVNFDLPESKIILDENGKPIDIKPYERSIATNMIEEFMLICNETIAEDFFWQEVPFLFRSHEIPDEQKLQKMEDFIRNFGYHLKGSKDDIHPKAIQQMLLKAEGKDEERIITRVVLRSMKQARYTAENGGHFGLAAKYYCHFTSPIRRYPDLQIHRIIKWILDGQMTEKKQKSLNKVMPDVAKQCSMRERTAEDAERATDDLKKAEYMADKIGMEYEGIISSLTSWGIYVELPNTVEGMVPLQSLEDDFYIYDEENMIIYGEHSNKKYMLGQKVNIIVTKVDIELKNIDFAFCEQ